MSKSCALWLLERARSGHSIAYRSSTCQRRIRVICYRSFIFVHVVHMKGNNKIHLWVPLKFQQRLKCFSCSIFFCSILFIYSDRVGFWQNSHPVLSLYLWPIFYFSCSFCGYLGCGLESGFFQPLRSSWAVKSWNY